MSIEQTLPLLAQLGDISGGNEQRLQSLALVMGQVSANGRLNGQDLLQFVNIGFNPLQAMVEKTGKSMATLRDEMSDGLVTTAMVAESINTSTSAGGLYFNAMENYAATAAGQLTLLKTEAQVLAAEMLTSLFPVIESTASGLRGIVSSVGSFKSGMSEGTAKVIAGVAAFGSMVLIVPRVIGVIRAIVIAVRGWIAANITLQALSGPQGMASIAAGLAFAAIAVGGVSLAYTEQDAAMAAATASAEAHADAVRGTAKAEGSAIAALAAKQAKQKESLESYTQEYRSIRDQNVALREGPIYAAEMLRLRKEQDMLDKGYTQPQIDSLALKVEENKALKKANKEEEDRNKLIKDRQNEVKNNLKSIGDNLRQTLETPYDALVNKFGEINAAMQAGVVTAGQAAQARGIASQKFGKDIAPVKVELPPSIMRGSREEYKLIAERMSGNKSREEARFKQQLAMQQAQVDAIKVTNDILAGQEQFDGVS